MVWRRQLTLAAVGGPNFLRCDTPHYHLDGDGQQSGGRLFVFGGRFEKVPHL
jgi:hypothetical protein